MHGADVVTVEAAPASPPAADAAVTTRVGLPLVVMVADCAPIALVTPGAVAVVHAGWSGLEQGVIEHAVAAARRVGGDPVTAVLGPVHPSGPLRVRSPICSSGWSPVSGPRSRVAPTTAIRRSTSLRACAPRSPRSASPSFSDVDVCTAASPDHFSARHEGTTGRQAVVVVRDA